MSREASKRLTGMYQEQGVAQQKEEVGKAVTETAKMTAEALPFAVAAPLTGGTSLLAGAGIMGAAGGRGLPCDRDGRRR